jgi:hypothetical protein
MHCSMIFSEDRLPLFGIIAQDHPYSSKADTPLRGKTTSFMFAPKRGKAKGAGVTGGHCGWLWLGALAGALD